MQPNTGSPRRPPPILFAELLAEWRLLFKNAEDARQRKQRHPDLYPSVFSEQHKHDLRLAFRSRNCKPLIWFGKATEVELLIAELENIAVAARGSVFDEDWNRYLANLEAEERGLTPPKRPRGRPRNMKRVSIARKVAWVLIGAGARSHRSRNLLPRSRVGFFSRALAVVFDAARMPALSEDDLFDLITRVATDIEGSITIVENGRVPSKSEKELAHL